MGGIGRGNDRFGVKDEEEQKFANAVLEATRDPKYLLFLR
jgi:hypothetical protein